MNRYRFQRLVQAATALVLVLVSCGGSDVGDEGPIGDATTTTTPATTTTAAPLTAAIQTFHPEGKGWELVWSDEFDRAELDESK